MDENHYCKYLKIKDRIYWVSADLTKVDKEICRIARIKTWIPKIHQPLFEEVNAKAQGKNKWL